MLLQFTLLIALVQKPVDPISPDQHARMVAEFLSDSNKSIPQADKPYLRFLSYYHLKSNPDVDTRLRTMRFWINSLHFESDPEFPHEVAGSDGLLFWIDLRDYGWTAAAWSSVAQREPYFREPAVNTGPAEFIRRVIGTTQNEKTLHVEGIVRGDWFFRETVELDRSPAYYDLLFAKQRHPGGADKYEDKVIDWPGGYSDYSKQVVAPGRYTIKAKKTSKAAFVDFPKNEKDVEKVLGVDTVRSFIKESKINLQHGAVVEGGEKGTSIVARQNRLLERTLGPVGYYYKTFDVKETSGKRDFSETLNKEFEFDAGEILFRLPAGGQGGLLVNAKGRVLNVADNRFATDSSDVRLDARVRNYGSCAVCHESGIIRPQNLIEEMLKAGVDIKFKDKREARDARAFFTQWEAKLVNDQAEYAAFIKRTSGFTPGENAKNFKAMRDAYDAPVDAQKASAECGVSLQVFLKAAARSTKARILNLVQGISMPRRTWETDGYPEATKLLSAGKPYAKSY